jgi:hypothetical protein
MDEQQLRIAVYAAAFVSGVERMRDCGSEINDDVVLRLADEASEIAEWAVDIERQKVANV